MANEIAVIEKVEDVQRELAALEEKGKEIVIKDQAGYDQAAVALVRIDRALTWVEENPGETKKKTWDAYQSALSLYNKFAKPLTALKQCYGKAMGIYFLDQENKRKEQEAKLQAELKKRDEDSRLNQAAELEKAGDVNGAEAVLNETPVIPQPVLPKAQAAGSIVRTTWHAEVSDLMALVKAVAAGHAPMEALQANMTYLNGRAKTDKASLMIPGVKAVPDTKGVLSSRRAVA